MKIMPLGEIEFKKISKKKILDRLKSNGINNLRELINRDYSYTRNGKEGIRVIMEHFKLSLEDEVYISTTTNSTYVVTCVSATLFNYAKISRVLTPKTKLIYVIHSFGFFNRDIFRLREIANKLNIPLVEDCAFAFDSITDNTLHGTIGDLTIYSLPKIFPIEYGGILSYTKRYNFDKRMDSYLDEELKKWLPKLDALKERRKLNYNYLLKNIKKPSIYSKISDENPFMFGFIDKNYDDIDNDFDNIYQTFSKDKEFGRTHVKNEVHLPTNSFIDLNEYDEIINRINNG